MRSPTGECWATDQTSHAANFSPGNHALACELAACARCGAGFWAAASLEGGVWAKHTWVVIWYVGSVLHPGQHVCVHSTGSLSTCRELSEALCRENMSGLFCKPGVLRWASIFCVIAPGNCSRKSPP